MSAARSPALLRAAYWIVRAGMWTALLLIARFPQTWSAAWNWSVVCRCAAAISGLLGLDVEYLRPSLLAMPFGTVRVSAVCAGGKELVVLLAAVLATTARWRVRIPGLVIACALFLFFNVARHVLFVYSFQSHDRTFWIYHDYVAPVVAIVVGVAYWWGYAVLSRRLECSIGRSSSCCS